ncbi:MAG: amidohydrolase family protein [Lachnospiraceae bacterium]|nr:amidohydrolase family protein [Lachnospiraceae bacterium]
MNGMRGMLYLPVKGTDNRFAFFPGETEYENGKITRVTVLTESDLTPQERDMYVLPGLIDIHLHGCMGVDFCDCAKMSDGPNVTESEGRLPDDRNVLETMCAYEMSHGITAICPATMTCGEEQLAAIMHKTREFVSGGTEKEQGRKGADVGQSKHADRVIGVYLEGPFISKEKCGAQNPSFIRKPDPAMIKRLQEASGGLIRMVAIAPELEGALECIQEFDDRPEKPLVSARQRVSEQACFRCGLKFTIAHTTADYDTAAAAIAAGAKHITHLYNAMPPLLSRAPGVIGAACDDTNTYVELIGDGVHVADPVVRATFKMFGSDRIVLISDSTAATGVPDGSYMLGDQAVHKTGNLVTLPDGTIAGSATNLFDCMKNVISMGIPAEEAIKCATINPARSIGADDFAGSIESGKRADFAVCDHELNLRFVIASGLAYNP